MQIDYSFPNTIFVKPDGRLTNEAHRFLERLLGRTGGSGTNDLIAESIEASPVITLHASIEKLRQDLEKLQTEVETWHVS